MSIDESVIKMCTFHSLHEYIREYYVLKKNPYKTYISDIQKNGHGIYFDISRCGLLTHKLHPDRDYSILIFKYNQSNPNIDGKDFIVSNHQDASLDYELIALDLLRYINNSVFKSSFKTNIERMIHGLETD